jgi:hypothetical protein
MTEGNAEKEEFHVTYEGEYLLQASVFLLFSKNASLP